MKLSTKGNNFDLKLQVASLIDVVFLLLIYFMVTASLIQKEADIGFALPEQGQPEFEVPIEVVIQIEPDGIIEVDGLRYSEKKSSMDQLVDQIEGLRHLAKNQGSEFHVSLLPHGEALHYRVIDVMDACTEAGVESLSFNKSI